MGSGQDPMLLIDKELVFKLVETGAPQRALPNSACVFKKSFYCCTHFTAFIIDFYSFF